MTATYPESPRGLTFAIGFGSNRVDDPIDDVTFTQVSPDPDDATDPGPVLSGVTITRGRVGDGATTEPTKIETALRNTSGEFSPRNPAGPHYGKLLDGTLVRTAVWVDESGTPTEYVRGIGNTLTFLPVADGWDTDLEKAIDPRVPINAFGGLARINLETIDESPLTRFYAQLDPAPDAYWPLDDDRDATQARSGVPGGKPMTYHGAVRPGQTLRPAGASAATSTLGDGSTGVDGYLLGKLPTGVFEFVPGLGGGGITFDFAVAIDKTGEPEGTTSRGVGFTATAYLDAVEFTATIDSITVSLNAGTVTFAVDITDGDVHHVRLTLTSGTTDTDVDLIVDDVSDSDTISGKIFTGDYWRGIGGEVRLSGAHYFAPSDVDLGWGPATWSHFAAWLATDGVSAYDAATAYVGELADDRIGRLLSEFDIPSAVATTGGKGEPLGPQSTGSLTDLLRDAEAADHGILYEDTNGRVDYLPRADLENQTALEIPFTKVTDLYPVQADRYNVITVNASGESATVEITDGNKGTSKIGPARYETDINVPADRLAAHAAWIARAASVDAERYIVVLDLRNEKALRTAGVHSSELIGRRITVTAPPVSDHGDDVDLLVAGYVEPQGAEVWTIVAHCDPYRPYNIGQLGGPGRLTVPAGVTLSGNLSKTATTVIVTAAVFSNASAPYDIVIGGERMTVTAATTTNPVVLNANPNFETDATNWTAQNGASVARTTAQSHQGSAALRITPDGSTAVPQATSEEIDATPGADYTVSAWLRSLAASSRTCKVGIFWLDADHSLLSADEIEKSLAAATWTQLTDTFTAPVGAAHAQVFTNDPGTPTSGWDMDEATLTVPQQLTVTRSVNGAVKSHNSGAAIDMYEPLRTALGA